MLLPLGLLLATLVPLDEAGFQKLTAAHKGRVVLYEFWATWCEPCRAEMPQLIRLQAKLKERGFELITISADEPEQQAAATASRDRLAQSGKYRRPIVTLIEPAATFYRAEDYHQQYLEKRGLSTCKIG